MSETYLSELETEKIKVFMSDAVAVEAVRKVLLAGIYYNGTLVAGQKADPVKNFALSLAFNPTGSNEDLGADVRAAAQGIKFVEMGFDKLRQIGQELIESQIEMTENPAE